LPSQSENGLSPAAIPICQSARKGNGVSFDHQIKIETGALEQQIAYETANDI